jgi:hypothetical protein
MDVPISQAIVDALKHLTHVPDSLQRRLDAIARGGDGYVLKLSDDDAMALAELLQWHIKTDPATGKTTPETAPLDDLVRRLDEAQFG